MPEQLHEPTKYEILEAINKLSEHMDQQFAEVRQELAKKATTEELATVKATMVTMLLRASSSHSGQSGA
jgi:hypothetical protein